MAQSSRRARSGGRGRSRQHDNTGVLPQLARAAREVEAAASRGKVSPANRVKFQVVALLMRDERARAKTDEGLTGAQRADTLKRLDGLGGILAKTAARDTSLLSLLEPDAPVGEAARALRKQMLFAAGVEVVEDDLPPLPARETRAVVPAEIAERQVMPRSVKSRLRAMPFLAPNLENLDRPTPGFSRLANWELLTPLFRAFEQGAGEGTACMPLPEAPKHARLAPRGTELMKHQARFLESVRQGHRTFLLADEPGLGKTAQAALAASVAGAYPLLCVVPNVVKMNWKREVERWTPGRRATVIQGDGDDLDAYADVIIVNYDVLDRHLSWLREIGFAGMIVDEAHFIKNMHSRRSQLVQSLGRGIRERVPGGEPLLMALTGTPLINAVEDFKAIWQFLGWIDGEQPTPRLMAKLDDTGLIPSEPGFLSAARKAVIDMGIVRRRKIDVAKDLPAKRIADIPVELDDDFGRGVREAEARLAERLLARYERAMRAAKLDPRDIDEDRLRLIAKQEIEESKAADTGDNIFTMLRRIGQAKAQLAADYTAQLARNVGKVVFFGKHIDVMDHVERVLAGRDLKVTSIRGDQGATARQQAIDAFNTDPDVSVIVCSLTAAGVGVNLQAASNVVLAELSWTAAEQTQAIDRVHRIGQAEPVTAWRIVAAQTIDARIAELIDAKQGLAARALDGVETEAGTVESVQVEALTALLVEQLRQRGTGASEDAA